MFKSLFIQTETLVVIIAGMAALILDSSFITFSKDMERIWNIALDPYKFPPIRQMYIKYFLSVLLIVRTFTVHLTLALYVVMLWPAFFAEKSYLLVPWIVVGTIRLCADFLATIAGFFIASKYGFVNTLWFEFLLVQLLQHGPFFYIWITIVKFRLYLVQMEAEKMKKLEEQVYEIRKGIPNKKKKMEDRKRALEELKNTASFSMLTTIIDRINDKKKENMSTRSLDTLLEIIDRGQTSMNSDTLISNSMDSSMQSNVKQKLQISDEDIEEAKKNRTNWNYEALPKSDVSEEQDTSNILDLESYSKDVKNSPT